jgi:ketosteroid isomerase-like protein
VSQENVEFVEGVLAGAAGLDKAALIAALPELLAQIAAPDIEWVEDPQRADGRVYHGHAGVLQSFERWLEQWDEYGYEAERCVDCGDDVLVIAHEHARGRASGARVSSRIYSVLTIRDRTITRFQEFYDEGQATEAVGPWA